jgi:hypothetical protein
MIEKTSTGPRKISKGYFFIWISFVFIFFAFAGFTPTYFLPLITGSLKGLVPVIHIHGILFFLWTIIFLWQTWLIKNKYRSFHKSIGLWGISLATAMIIFGLIVSLQANAHRISEGNFKQAYNLGFGNLMAVLTFGVLFSLAIKYIKRSDYHKRLMIYATCMLLNAPVARLYRPIFSPDKPPLWLVFITIDSIIVACIVYDWKTLKRIHPVTISVGILLISLQILRPIITETEIWHSVYNILLNLIM